MEGITNIEEIIKFVEDKDFQIQDDWYLHATAKNVEVVKKILEEGIKSSYLRKENPNHFNGKYYISLYKYNPLGDSLNNWLSNCPEFVIRDINPVYADSKKLKLRRIFINTRIPLRTSE